MWPAASYFQAQAPDRLEALAVGMAASLRVQVWVSRKTVGLAAVASPRKVVWPAPLYE